ncbi:hypothetical protein [Neobacillus terrae]|uniref:hypothetical protein n=1 Tax=Neobacillus terrae TaxID=3034837 RepID=UPI00140C5C38|nr:hypothetical protein [Neobacillus terrae]NHM30846.1 hypothetical protein [Neobacillus terrae]
MITISGFIVELLFDLAGEIIGHFIPERALETKFQKNINRLKEETWFGELEKDYRYEYIIYQNSRVKRFLSSEKNIKMITSMDEERDDFINLIKEEH